MVERWRKEGRNGVQRWKGRGKKRKGEVGGQKWKRGEVWMTDVERNRAKK